MKSLVLLAFLSLPFLAQANFADVLRCSTPHGKALDEIILGVNASEEADIVDMAMTISEGVKRSYTAVTSSGALVKSLASGKIEFLLKSEQTVEDGGEITKAALLNLSKEGEEYNGLLAESGSVFPLRCEVIKQSFYAALWLRC